MFFSTCQTGALPPCCNPEGCKPEKAGKSAKNEKPGSVGKSTLPGVEVAGFPFGPQPIWLRLHTVELASYRLRKDSMKFPPLAVIESFPHGLLVPKLRTMNSNPEFPRMAAFPPVKPSKGPVFPHLAGSGQPFIKWTFCLFGQF